MTPSDTTEQLITDTGSWDPKRRPVGIYHDGVTYVGWKGHAVGGRSPVGITAYDHGEATTTSTVVEQIETPHPGDNHWAPAVHRRPDDRLLLAYARHSTVHVAIASEPGSIDTWSVTEHDLEIDNYPTPVRWNDELWLFGRATATLGHGGWGYHVSRDDGETWSEMHPFVESDIEGEWIYVLPYVDAANERMHLTIGDQRNDPSGVYHGYLADGTIHGSDGTPVHELGTPLRDKRRLTVIDETHHGPDEPDSMKMHDLIVRDGVPYAAWVSHETVSKDVGGSAGPLPSGDYRAMWGRWDGDDWIISEICPMGSSFAENHYISGGVYLDDQDPTVARASVECEDRNFQIQEWKTSDDGDTWTHTRDLSPAGPGWITPTKRGRPTSVRGHQGEIPAVYFAGKYDRYDAMEARIGLIWGTGSWTEWSPIERP